MAGIGFVLRKMSQQDNLSGWIRAHVNAIILATGPWIFTIFAFWVVRLSVAPFMSQTESADFMAVIVYNFSASSIFCGLINLVATRFIADCIYNKDASRIPSMMLTVITLSLLIQTPLAVWFYFYVMNVGKYMALLSVFNYLIITLIWQTGIFLTTIKNYNAVTVAFGSGLLLGMVAAYGLGSHFSISGVMAGFNLGLGCCLALILACILSEYPYPLKFSMEILTYTKRFWILALSGLTYNMALWVDKLIMWFSPDSTVLSSGIRVNFNYDSAMFMSYLSIIPALGVFMFSLETSFHEKWMTFYNDINRKANYAQIRQNQIELVNAVKQGINGFVAFQGLFTLLLILMAQPLLELFGVSMLRLGAFRFGLAGVFFHMLVLFLTIILSYFDTKKSILLIQAIFLLFNGLFTYLAMNADFVYYGIGYMMAAMITFATAAVITIHELKRLPFHAFIANNTSVES